MAQCNPGRPFWRPPDLVWKGIKECRHLLPLMMAHARSTSDGSALRHASTASETPACPALERY
jgi:hypothetical protein